MTNQHEATTNQDADDERVERSLRVWLTEGRPPVADRATQIDAILQSLDDPPRTRTRFLGRWGRHGRGARRHAAEYDHPPDADGRSRLMLSASGLVAVLAILALSASVIQTTPAPPSGGGGATHVVAIDGSGDHTTIQAAVDAAAAGDIITIETGTYEGPIEIDKDLSLAGSGSRQDVVILAPAGERWSSSGEEVDRPHALHLSASEVSVSDLTVEVPIGSTGIESTNGSPLIERVSIHRIASDESRGFGYDPYYSMGFYGETTPTILDSEWDGYTAVRDGASATFDGNTITLDGISIDGPGTSIVRDNTFVDAAWLNTSGPTAIIEGNDFTGGSVSADSASVVEIRSNTFRDVFDAEAPAAIYIEGAGTRAVIVDNTVESAATGISLGFGSLADVEDNSLSASLIGIIVGTGESISVSRNDITGDGAGIVILPGMGPTITGNAIEVDGRGIAIDRGSAPLISDNVVCGGMANIHIADDAEPRLSGNEICQAS